MLTVPSASVAVAAMLIVAGEVKPEFAAGLVKLTSGATSATTNSVTLTATEAEVVTAPLSSVASAVIVYDPAATLLQL